MDGEENAFATLWGEIYITEELLENIWSYEALDFVVGHEIGHVESRDVLRSLVSQAPLTILLSIFWWDYGAVVFDGVVDMTHGKSRESKADRFGLDFVYNKNGHVGCAVDFFSERNTIWDNIMEIFSSHPMTTLRIERAKKYIEKQWYKSSKCTPVNL